MSSLPSQATATSHFKLHSPAVDFVENRLPEYHSVFDHPNSRFDPRQQKFVADSLYDAMSSHDPPMLPEPDEPDQPAPRPPSSEVHVMKFWQFIFPTAMDRLRHDPEPDKQRTPQYSIRSLEKWKQVSSVLEQAQRSYEFREHTSRVGKMIGSTRRKLRRLADKAIAPAQQASKFIPNTDFASPVTAVVGVLLDAYKQATEAREELRKGFDDLPHAFEDVDFYITTFPKDSHIRKASEDLVYSIFKAIEHAIGFYTGHQIGRFGSAIGRGDTYKQALMDSLVEITSRKEHLEKEGWKTEIHSRLEESKRNAQARKEAKVHEGNMIRAKNEMFALFEDVRLQGRQRKAHRTIDDMHDISRPRSPKPMDHSTSGKTYTPEEIWEMLHIPELDEVDIETVMKRSGRIPFEDRGRAEQIVSNRQFKEWALNESDHELLVHGDFGVAGEISPLSVLTATIGNALRSRVGFISLMFFCGCHLEKDELSGPLVLIRSLVGQLLQQFPSIPPTLCEDVSLESVEQGNIQELCALLKSLVRAVPADTTIFCLIDGIQLYERDLYWNDMEIILSSILDLARDKEQKLKAKMKIFLSSPKRTTLVRSYLNAGTSLLNMATISSTGQAPSAQRLNRQLEAHF